MKKQLITIITFVLTIVILALAVKGQEGNPIYFQTEKNKMVGGPFESSNSTSRYALVESIVENNSLTFTEDQAQFAAPDLVSSNGKLFSIFTPGVSFVGVPFYMLGKLFGLPQLFTYFSTLIFAVLNVFLIARLGKKMGANTIESYIAGLIFLFGTNAFSYAFSFTQHHMSTTFILLALINTLSKRTTVNNLIFGILYGVGLLADIPNGIMMLPLVSYVLAKHVSVTSLVSKIKLSLKLNVVMLAVGLSLLLSIFAWYNIKTSGSPMALAQAIGRADFTEDGAVARTEESLKASIYDHGGVFDTRPQLNGAYTLLLSNERGWIYYSPVILIGIIGFIYASREKNAKVLGAMATSIAFVSIVVYASFGDPWGGWSFGARYLIPAAGMMSIGIALAINKLKRNPLFIFVFLVLLVYSVAVNTLGALTTSAIPPKIEAVNLTEPIPYTYEYNWQFIQKSHSSSLLFNMFFYHFITLTNYFYAITAGIVVWISGLFVINMFGKKEKKI